MLGEVISTPGPIYINCSESLAVIAKFNWSSPLSYPFKCSMPSLALMIHVVNDDVSNPMVGIVCSSLHC